MEHTLMKLIFNDKTDKSIKNRGKDNKNNNPVGKDMII